MEPTTSAQLGITLVASAAAMVAFNLLIGRGARGTLWIIALACFCWSTTLPIVLDDPDSNGLSPLATQSILVLNLTGIVGALLGIVDVFGRRRSDQEFPIAEDLLRQPLIWGLGISGVFFAMLYTETINSPLLWRYTAGHPVEVVEAAFFFIGMAILAIRLGNICTQFKSLDALLPAGGRSVSECDTLLAQLGELPHSIQETYLVRRLREAVQFVRRKGSAADLDQHLRHLEDLGAIEMHSGYATLRIIIWAIPILGFLGTVIGITVAIASLSPEALEQSMSEVTTGLGVAFDTTAEALALTMVLMFSKALVEKVESRLLSGVDARVADEMLGRFQQSVPDNDPNVATIRRMSEQVIDAVEALASRQADVWKQAIEETHQQWADVSMASGQILKNSLSKALGENLEQHARILSQNALKHADRLSESAGQHVEKLQHNSQETVSRLRDGLEKLAELLVEALEKHGEVMTTNEREVAERQVRSFEEMSRELSAAMELIGTRTGNPQVAMHAEPAPSSAAANQAA